MSTRFFDLLERVEVTGQDGASDPQGGGRVFKRGRILEIGTDVSQETVEAWEGNGLVRRLPRMTIVWTTGPGLVGNRDVDWGDVLVVPEDLGRRLTGEPFSEMTLKGQTFPHSRMKGVAKKLPMGTTSIDLNTLPPPTARGKEGIELARRRRTTDELLAGRKLKVRITKPDHLMQQAPAVAAGLHGLWDARVALLWVHRGRAELVDGYDSLGEPEREFLDELKDGRRGLDGHLLKEKPFIAAPSPSLVAAGVYL